MSEEKRIEDLEHEVGRLSGEVYELKQVIDRMRLAGFISQPHTVFDEQGRLQV